MIDRVLLVDDDHAVREALGQSLELADLCPTLAASFIEAKDHIARDFAGVIVTDLRMPGKDGFHLLEHVRQIDEGLPVILLTGEGDVPLAVRGMSAGAFDFLEKPCAPKDLIAVIQKALRTRALVLENRALKTQINTGDAAARLLFGESAKAEELRARVRSVAKLAAEIMVTGPPGSGIPKVAEVIHMLAGTAVRPFVKLPGATADAATFDEAWQRAQGGTLFIDEVTALPDAAQYRLLEKLELADGTVRLIAGTSLTQDQILASGRLNTDLFYKIDVMRVRIPALSERPEDIPVLFRRYVAQACEQAALPEPLITPEVISSLMTSDWPGNARALMSAAMRFSLGLSESAQHIHEGPGLAEQMAQIERALLIAALERQDGNASEAARELKLPRKTFYDKLARLDVRPGLYRK